MTIVSGKHNCPNRLDPGGCRNCPFCDPECAAVLRMPPREAAKWNQEKSRQMGINMRSNQHRQATHSTRYSDREIADWLMREMRDRESERTRASQTHAPAPPDLFARIRAAHGVQPAATPAIPLSATPRVAPRSAPPPPDLFALIRAAAREKGTK